MLDFRISHFDIFVLDFQPWTSICHLAIGIFTSLLSFSLLVFNVTASRGKVRFDAYTEIAHKQTR